MLVFEQRASTILYNFLVSNHFKGKFLLPANICPIVPLCFLKAGVGFDLVDIDPSTLSLDFVLAASKIQTNPDAFSGLVFVHTYGDPTSFENEFQKIKKNFPGLVIIDDCCLCIPDFSEPSLGHADLILYSTGYGKMVDVGSGGFGWLKNIFHYKPRILDFNSEDLKSIEEQYKIAIANQNQFNYMESNWLDTTPVSAPDDYSIKVSAMTPEILNHKETLNKIYSSSFPQSIQMNKRFQEWRFSIRVSHKQQLLDNIFSTGLFASTHYASLGNIFAEGNYPQAEKLHSSVINLFNDQHFSIEMAKKIVEIVNDHLNQIGVTADVQN